MWVADKLRHHGRHHQIIASGRAEAFQGGFLKGDALQISIFRRRAGVDGLNDNVGVEEMRGDHVGDERGVVFLENDRHYVVADVTFSLKLLTRKKYTCTYTVTSVSHSKVLLNSRQL